MLLQGLSPLGEAWEKQQVLWERNRAQDGQQLCGPFPHPAPAAEWEALKMEAADFPTPAGAGRPAGTVAPVGLWQIFCFRCLATLCDLEEVTSFPNSERHPGTHAGQAAVSGVLAPGLFPLQTHHSLLG